MEQNTVLPRVLDVIYETGVSLTPISFTKTPLVGFEESLKPLKTLIPDLDSHILGCLSWIDNLDQIPFNLTRDEGASINLYTREWTDRSDSLYYRMNISLRSTNRREINPYLCYLKLLLTALYKIPSYKSPSSTLWRGMKDDNSMISDMYKKEKKYFWWGFSSCTTNMDSLSTYLGVGVPCVLFNIHFLSHAVDIRSLSLFANENEVLLLPGCHFEVLNCFKKFNNNHY